MLLKTTGLAGIFLYGKEDTKKLRKKRKLEHLNLVRNLDDGPGRTGFEDLYFVHNCLPETDPSEINTATQFCGREIEIPLMINAITGGIPEAEKINRALAVVARRMKIPMAVGSQTAALQDRTARFSYEVVRVENPEGFIAANVGAGVTPDYALEAVKMIDADALQLHLNVPQEVMMPGAEGDLCFSGYLKNIESLVKASPVPVIVKEVGYGIAREQAKQLLDAGVTALDIGGKGGTNFIKIEGLRHSSEAAHPFLNWGIPTVVSLIETAAAAGSRLDIAAAGGVRSGLDAAKAFRLGACLAGLAGPLVRCYFIGGETAIEDYLLQLQMQLKQVMLMLGARNITELRDRPILILGETGEWLKRRGVDLNQFAQRGSLT
ncbi:MAG: type 2 isopentenyl-diphosphate Delta-isomerase [Bacillota bacterium]|nr:type 2 isopentenyl-diphosphate Delta-isomerase [Bacillota bacterium]